MKLGDMMLETIWKRKTNWLGHYMIRDYLMTSETEETIDGKRGGGRKGSSL